MYRTNAGLEFASYTDACIYHGADTPADIAAEIAYEREEARREYHGEAMIQDARAAGLVVGFEAWPDAHAFPF
jgi:hypothetical protein